MYGSRLLTAQLRSLVSAYCDRRDSLDSLCGQITGDATLYSMFRSDAGPTECPFTGGPPFTFTYSRGAGECSIPVSRVDPCTDESRLLLRYQACPDIHGTESTGKFTLHLHKLIFATYIGYCVLTIDLAVHTNRSSASQYRTPCRLLQLNAAACHSLLAHILQCFIV
jgi:hypothetical protein